MTNLYMIAGEGAGVTYPSIRTIRLADLKYALARGLDDFCAMPSHLLFISIIYPVVAFFAARLAFGYVVLELIYPLAAGLPLMGLLAAIGLCELSRCRERGLTMCWRHAFDVFRSSSVAAIVMLAALLLMIFIAWLGAAEAIYRATMGTAAPASYAEFIRQVFTTSGGWALIVLGNCVGLLFAATVLTISVVSIPLLLEGEVSAATAIRISVQAVLANPKTMALWGAIVGSVLAISCLLLFVGLAVVIPVLGHSTWHLYRKLVARRRAPLILVSPERSRSLG